MHPGGLSLDFRAKESHRLKQTWKIIPVKNVELNRSVSGSAWMETNPSRMKQAEIMVSFDEIMVGIRGDTAAPSIIYCLR
jgi:hypothetical protein